MEGLPVELVGQILSRLGSARDVVLASLTCRKWREAYRKHLKTLVFNSADWRGYDDLSSTELELLITRTIFQTSGLERLSIWMRDDVEFWASAVTAWLMYTRETLLELSYNVPTTPELNILDICGTRKLEKLVFADDSITLLEYNSRRYPCLKSLSLHNVTIWWSDLSRLVAACPKIEILELFHPNIETSYEQVTVELSSPSLKTVCVEGIDWRKFILQADSIESLRLKHCLLKFFKLVGKGTLKHFKIYKSSIVRLDIGGAVESLEVVDISKLVDCKTNWSTLYQMISRSTTLRRLRLWEVDFGNEYEVVDLDQIAKCFPQLTRLSLSDGLLHYGLQGSCKLENVLVLKLGWTIISDSYVDWVEWLVKHCPSLQKLIINGVVSDVTTDYECQILASLTSFIVELMRKLTHVKVRFVYE